MGVIAASAPVRTSRALAMLRTQYAGRQSALRASTLRHRASTTTTSPPIWTRIADYDGGDCCSCTCTVEEGRLGCLVFACIDPMAECVDDDDATIENVKHCGYAGSIGDGHCMEYNNKEECGYDGGDCCECTCEGDSVYSCRAGTFNCIDPEAWCVDDDIITSMSFDFIY
ncbi:unnamed protein product [Sphacelaria rigidula]